MESNLDIPADTEQMARAFAALGAPQRLDVLRLLVRAGESGLTVGKLQERLDIPGSTLSHHLRALVQAGVMTQAREGRSLICRADFAAIRGLSDFILRECCADESCVGEETSSERETVA